MVERRYAITLSVIQAIFFAAFAIIVIGLPFGGGTLGGLTYFSVILNICVGALASEVFILSVASNSNAIRTISIVIWIILVLWQIFTAAIWFSIVYIGCDGDIQCADNLSCSGTVLRPYDGPRLRFLAMYIESIVTIVVIAITVFVAFSIRLSMLTQMWDVPKNSLYLIMVHVVRFAITLAVEVTVVGLSYPNDSFGMMTFWAYVLFIGLELLADMMFSIYIMFRFVALNTVSLIFVYLSTAWNVFVALIWIFVIYSRCDSDVSCASNLACDGIPSGPFVGPSGRFIALMCEGFISVIVGLVTIFMLHSIRRRNANIQKTTQPTTSSVPAKEPEAEEPEKVGINRYHHQQHDDPWKTFDVTPFGYKSN